MAQQQQQQTPTNRYKTIIDFCESRVMKGGTVIESLEDLVVAFKNRGVKNELVEKGLDTATRLVKADKTHKIKNYLIQGFIVETMRRELI
jgi:hypothetical protein